MRREKEHRIPLARVERVRRRWLAAAEAYGYSEADMLIVALDAALPAAPKPVGLEDLTARQLALLQDLYAGRTSRVLRGIHVDAVLRALELKGLVSVDPLALTDLGRNLIKQAIVR